MGRLKSFSWKFGVTLAVLLFIYWYFTNQIQWDELQQASYTINWGLFGFGVLISLLSNWLDGLAWHRILYFLDDRITAWDALMAHWIGFSIGILIPVAGTAELASKTLILQRKYPGFPSEAVISSIAAIRTVFLITAYGVWGFLIVSLGAEGIFDPNDAVMNITITAFILLVVYIFLTIIIIALILFFGNADRLAKGIDIIGKPFQRFSSLKRFQVAIEGWLKRFAENFQHILKMPRKEKIIMLSLVFSQNFIKWFSVYIIFLAVIDLPFYVVMISSVLGGFVNLVPAAIPGLVGLREIVGQLSLDIFINDQNLAFVATVIQSLGLWIFFALAGLVSIPYVLFSLKNRVPLEENENSIEAQTD